MDVLESIYELAQRNFLDIVTILWAIWCAGVGLGMVICTISSCCNRRTCKRIKRRLEHNWQQRQREPDNFDLDQEALRHLLIRREREFQEDIDRMGLDFESQAVLEYFQARIQAKLADIPASYQELIQRLESICQGLNEFKDLFGAEQILCARVALKRGDSSRALALLKRVHSLVHDQMAAAGGSKLAVSRATRLAAQAAFLLGQLADNDFNYFQATQYYQQAADLMPGNTTFLNAAAGLSYAFGELHETEYLLKLLLKIQEKLLGPEHPDLAQTLNNLGVLRHTQGRLAEAEAFYQWALEVSGATLNPQAPEALNLMQNYTTLLKEVGRSQESKFFAPRVAVA
jgi:tetratricopeptide (TPR) repeat protein